MLPFRCHLYCRCDFKGCIALILLHRIGSSRHSQQQSNLLHDAKHGIFTVVSGGSKILSLDLVKLLHYHAVHFPFLGQKWQRHLMDTTNLLACHLFKRAGNDRFSQEPIEFIGVIDVLGPLRHTKHSCLFRKMAGGKQSISVLVSWDWTAIVRLGSL